MLHSNDRSDSFELGYQDDQNEKFSEKLCALDEWDFDWYLYNVAVVAQSASDVGVSTYYSLGIDFNGNKEDAICEWREKFIIAALSSYENSTNLGYNDDQLD